MKPNQTHITWSSKLPLFYLSSAAPPVHLIGWVDPVCREEHVAQGGLGPSEKPKNPVAVKRKACTIHFRLASRRPQQKEEHARTTRWI